MLGVQPPLSEARRVLFRHSIESLVQAWREKSLPVEVKGKKPSALLRLLVKAMDETGIRGKAPTSIGGRLSRFLKKGVAEYHAVTCKHR